MSLYRVVGSWPYREHEPGECFEAVLEAEVEARAVKHGAIEVLERSNPQIQPGCFTEPSGWLTQIQEV